MVATRALLERSRDLGTAAALRRCVRDLVSLSSLPALWIKADAAQIADSLGQLAVSILDADFACVLLRDPDVEILHCHQRSLARPISIAQLREKYRPNATFDICADGGRLRAMCVPIGREAGSGLIVLGRRPGFAGGTERMLLQVVANQAATAIERWRTESERAEQARALERLHQTQTALYAFTDQLFRAETRSDVYDAGLDAILRILHCDRASLLLFDDSDAMRFVAWRGLSEDYRKAVDGHSPWKPDDVDAGPICIGDIDQAAGLDAALKAVVKAEGIAALAFFPIFASGKVAGKFMAYYDRPHTFSSTKIDAGVTIARQLGFGLERLRDDETRRRLATIVETSDDAIISKNLDGIIQTWNAGAERIFGYTAAETIGKPVTLLMPPERQDEEPGILARLRRGERIDHYQTVRQRKDGTLIDISLTVSPVRDRIGRIIGASKIARDVTDQKRAETALRDSERRLQELLSAIPAAIYTTDAEGRITYYNDAAVELAGRRPTIGVDKWSVIWKMYWPDGTPVPADQCPMAAAIRDGRLIRGKEAVAERPDGTRVPYISFPTPLRDTSGRIVGAINMLVDVSERKQAESYQRMLMQELNHRVKNNMMMLQALLHVAMRDTENREARKVLEDAANRVSAMAAAQRVLYGASTANRFRAAEFLDSVCATAQQIFPPEIRIVRDAADGEFDNDDAMPLALILNELLTNAAKYGCNGAGENRIRVGLTNARGSELYVEDCGPGFDLEGVGNRSSGLKLVQLLARQLRGQLEVTTKPASRCTVRFRTS
ncbi:MAG TPA: PAS domain S-box protein [Rhizomicrobium sp.]|nr:PAS domain S-box protein [Rhizomicrobium sp.]